MCTGTRDDTDQSTQTYLQVVRGMHPKDPIWVNMGQR